MRSSSSWGWNPPFGTQYSECVFGPYAKGQCAARKKSVISISQTGLILKSTTNVTVIYSQITHYIFDNFSLIIRFIKLIIKKNNRFTCVLLLATTLWRNYDLICLMHVCINKLYLLWPSIDLTIRLKHGLVALAHPQCRGRTLAAGK